MKRNHTEVSYKIHSGSIFHGDKIDYDLADKWDDLVLNSLHPNIFLTWEWISIWIKWFASNNELKIVTIWDGPYLIGIIPLYIGPIELFRGIHVKGFKYIGDGDVVFPDYLGPMIRQGRLNSILSCLEEVFVSNNSNCRLMRLADMDLASEGANSLVDALCKGTQYDIRQSDISPHIKFSGDYESFFSGLNPRRRESVRKKNKKVLKNFQVRLICHQSEDKVREAFAIMFEIFSKATRGKDKIQGFMRKDYLGFHQDVASAIAKKGWLRIYLLYFNDRPVAYIYGYVFNNVFWYYQTAFDLTFKDHSPGAVILQMVIKSVIEEGVQEFDFLRGDEDYKFYLSNGHRQLSTIYLFKHKRCFYLLYKLGGKITRTLSSAKNLLKPKAD